MKVKVGDRVRLMKIEDCPEEVGIVLTIDHMSWGTSIIVQVDPEYKDGELDDLLRECTSDQVIEVMK